VEAPHTVSRRDWNHREARCPRCGLHLDPQLDLQSYERENTDTRARGALVTHRRCGASFRILFTD
jgi:hypothetical protein